MKVQRLKPSGDLIEFAFTNLPESLMVRKVSSSYGYDYEICIKYKRRGILDFTKPLKIADIKSDSVELFQPQYFSDMEILCKAFEDKFKMEVTLKYWECD